MSDYLKEGFIDEVKGCLGGRGGQENVIESIKVNGVGQTVDENKAVNIPVPTKTSDLDNDSGYQTNSEVSSTVAAEVTKIVANAPEDFDTLKEMSDWISQHEDSAAAMNSAILKNKEDIEALQTSKADQDDVDVISEDIGELNSNLSQLKFGEYAGGKNLFDIEDLSTSSSAWGIVHKSVYIPKGTYTLSLKSTTSSEFQFYDASNNLIKKFGIGSSGTNRIYNALELTEDCYYLNVWINNGTLSDIQIELGTTATSYEPYIPSVKMLAEDVKTQNDSLEEYGLNNLYHGTLEKQSYINGSWTPGETWVRTVDKTPCKGGDIVSVKTAKTWDMMYILFFKSDDTIIEAGSVGSLTAKTDTMSAIAPSNASYFMCQFGCERSGSHPTVNDIIHTYVNNGIDKIKNDLFDVKANMSHNIPRTIPKDITSYYNDGTIWKRLNGTDGFSKYEDIFVGDYFKMSRAISAYNQDQNYQLTGSDWVTIAGISTLLGNGDTGISYEHLVMVPGKGFGGTQHFGRSRMNPTHTTVGGYVGSEMHTTTIGEVVSSGSTATTATINQQLYAEFGSHLKTTRELLSNAINSTGYNRFGSNTGCSNNWIWTNCQAVLMSEIELYGSIVWSSSGYDTGNANKQLPLFVNSKQAINNRSAWYWLKDAASARISAVAAAMGMRAAAMLVMRTTMCALAS